MNRPAGNDRLQNTIFIVVGIVVILFLANYILGQIRELIESGYPL